MGSPHLSSLRSVLTGALWLCGFSAMVHAASTLTVPTEIGSGITIEIDTPLSQAPPTGLYPMLVKIHNGAGATGEWTVGTGNAYGRGGVSTQTPIVLGAGKSAAVWIYAPLSENPYGARQLQVTLHGTRVVSGGSGGWSTIVSNTSSSSSSALEMDFPGFSGKVARSGESALLDRYKKEHGGGGELDHTKVDLEQDIGDWRALSGLGQLWMTDEEWAGMDGGTRSTVMDWLTQGGRLVLLCVDVSADRLSALKVPAADGNGSRRVGAGRVVLLQWGGVTFPIDLAMPLLKTHDDGDVTPKLISAYHDQWKLPEIVGTFSVHGWLIFGFIVAFGLLVGPVNLFYFAGARQRHRMFWTTPLISLAGGTVLVLVMIFQDGIGGSGARRILAIMNPAQKKTAFLQEQVSRTGVLLGTSFSIPEPVLISQLSLNDPSTFSPVEQMARQNFESGDVRTGDWFASRSRQAHLTLAVRPSRGGIEFYPSAGGQGVPSVVSSLAAPLREVYLVDEQGKVWKAQEVATGVKKQMIPSDQGEFKTWITRISNEELGPLAKSRLERMRGQKAQVFAVSADADSFAVPTLKSIRWSNQSVIFAGPYEKR